MKLIPTCVIDLFSGACRFCKWQTSNGFSSILDLSGLVQGRVPASGCNIFHVPSLTHPLASSLRLHTLQVQEMCKDNLFSEIGMDHSTSLNWQSQWHKFPQWQQHPTRTTQPRRFATEKRCEAFAEAEKPQDLFDAPKSWFKKHGLNIVFCCWEGLGPVLEEREGFT